MRFIDTAALFPTPWKNGSGSTRELACFPAGASMDNFDWRISIAEVDESGPFSLFPGVDRVIALLHGAGMWLDVRDGRSHALTNPLEPFVFSGEDKVHAKLVSGPSIDFNVMCRRDKARGRIDIHQAAFHIDAAQHALALMVVKGSWAITDNDDLRHDLVSGQMLLADTSHPALDLLPRKEGSTLLCATIEARQE
jgi:hypothetical protein